MPATEDQFGVVAALGDARMTMDRSESDNLIAARARLAAIREQPVHDDLERAITDARSLRTIEYLEPELRPAEIATFTELVAATRLVVRTALRSALLARVRATLAAAAAEHHPTARDRVVAEVNRTINSAVRWEPDLDVGDVRALVRAFSRHRDATPKA